MALGGSWQSPMRLSAVELGPSKVSRSNIPGRKRKHLSADNRAASCAVFEPSEPNHFFGFISNLTPGVAYSIQRSARGE